LPVADAIGARLCRDAIWAGRRCNWLGASMEPVGGQRRAKQGGGMERITVVGLGGSLVQPSRSLAALKVALDGAAAEGAAIHFGSADRSVDGSAPRSTGLMDINEIIGRPS